MQFIINDTKIISRLIEGEFIRYENIIPKEWDTQIKVDVDELSMSLDRISTIANEEGNNTVKMSIYEDKLSMSTETSLGNIHEELDISINGKNLDITFNIRYISDVLKHLDSDVDRITSYNVCYTKLLRFRLFAARYAPVLWKT